MPEVKLKARELGSRVIAGDDLRGGSIVYSNRTITIPNGLLAAAQSMLSGSSFSAAAMRRSVSPALVGELETLIRAFVAEGLVGLE